MVHHPVSSHQSYGLKTDSCTPTSDSGIWNSDDTGYAQKNDLPAATDPAGWHGRTRRIIYGPAFRNAFARLSRQHQRQTRTNLERFFRMGISYGSAKIETIQTNRGWMTGIPADVDKYQCARLSSFLRFAYNLIGNDGLIVYNIAKKNEFTEV